MRKTNELLVKSLEDQGFSSKQIETIQKNKLLRFDSKREKGAYGRAIERQERESKQRERERRAQRSTTEKSKSKIRSTRSQSTPTTKRTSTRSTQKPFSSIRVGDTKPTSRSTSNTGRDYGKIASADWPRANPSRNEPPIIPYDNPQWERMPGRGGTPPSLSPQPGGSYPMAQKGDTQIAQAGPGVRYQKFSDAPGSTRTRGQSAPPVPDYKYDPHMKMMVPYIPKAG